MTAHGDSEGAATAAPVVAALEYAARGWLVLPLRGKVPATTHGLKDASADLGVVEDWWRRWPGVNVGLRTGAESGLLVLDVDPRHGGDDALAELEAEHGELPETVECLTGGGGRHVYFAHPGRPIRNSAGLLGDGLDIRGDGGYVVAAPSVHESGRRYEWEVSGDPGEHAPAQAPRWLLDRLEAPPPRGRDNGGGEILDGGRNHALTSLAGAMRRKGMGADEIAAALAVTNSKRCRPPLDEREVDAIAASVGRYAPAEQREPPDVPATDLQAVTETFKRWLHLPDPVPLYAVLGTVAANYLDGDPVWLVLVGPPGGGKSELLQATATLPEIHPAATLTEPALLSGTSKKEKDAAAKGGLLRAIGDFGLILCKDFGSVLSMNRDARAATLAALREVYDGSWTRHVGTDGGRTLHWSGKVGLIAGSTPSIDRHHAVMGAMGERFVLVRLAGGDRDAQARRSLAHAGHETRMRHELATAVAGLFKHRNPREPLERTPADIDRLVALSGLVAVCRSAVERDGYTREVELVPDAEAPTRLVKVLDRLLAGLDAIGLDRAEGWPVVARAALDSVPALRRATVEVLHATEGDATTTEVAARVRHPANTTRRALEDLAAHRVVNREPGGKGHPDRWALAGDIRALYDAATGVPETSVDGERRGVPETSEDPQSLFIKPKHVLEDISGTPPGEGAGRP